MILNRVCFVGVLVGILAFTSVSVLFIELYRTWNSYVIIPFIKPPLYASHGYNVVVFVSEVVRVVKGSLVVYIEEIWSLFLRAPTQPEKPVIIRVHRSVAIAVGVSDHTWPIHSSSKTVLTRCEGGIGSFRCYRSAWGTNFNILLYCECLLCSFMALQYWFRSDFVASFLQEDVGLFAKGGGIGVLIIVVIWFVLRMESKH